MLLSVSEGWCCQRRGWGVSPIAIAAENTGVAGRRGDVGEPSTRGIEREWEVTGDFSAGKTGLCCP